jgi:hypothetical protein
VRAIKEMNPAPRGALLYPRHSREELGGTFLDLMPNLASKDKGNSSLAEKTSGRVQAYGAPRWEIRVTW